MSARSVPASTIFTGGTGVNSQNTSRPSTDQLPGEDTAEVHLVADRARPGEQLAVVEQRREDARVVLMQAAADPRVVAEEHVARANARDSGPVLQRPLDRHIQRRGQLGVDQADLYAVATLVEDRGAEVVAVGHNHRAGHPLQCVTHLLGDRGEAVTDHLVGKRIQLGDRGGRDVVQRNALDGLADLRGSLRLSGETLGAGDGNDRHSCLPSSRKSG